MTWNPALWLCLALLLPVPSGAIETVDACAQIPEPSGPVRPKVVISDLHLGSGRVSEGKFDPLEDFRFDATLESFLAAMDKDGPVDLVIAGDFIDFWQVLPCARRTEGATERESLDKLRLVLLGHKETFAVLHRFVQRGNRLIVVPGNHDVDLQWPAVQNELKAAFGAESGQVQFAVPCYESHGLHVEHGHQYDYANRFSRAEAPMVDGPAGRRLETNWGFTFVSSFYNQIETLKPFIDNLSPSLAAAWWALRSEPPLKFGLPQVGKLLVMLLRDQRALANLGYLSYTLGDEEVAETPAPPKTVDSLVRLYENADPALAEPLKSLLQDPDVRKEAEDALQELPDAEWRRVRIGREDPTLGRVFVDPYIAASKDILRAHRGIRVVVMGHTHDLDASVIPLTDVGQTPKWFVNSGCWQKSRAVKDARDIGWGRLSLDDPAMFPDRFSYVRVRFDPNGIAMEPERAFWPAAR
jgi:UDP-2,3-diacylglucosamine pyrophosphatase LpxH